MRKTTGDDLLGSGVGSANGEGMPGPTFGSPLQFLATMRRDPLGFFGGLRDQYGDIARIRYMPFPLPRFRPETWLFTHPREVKYVLQLGAIMAHATQDRLIT